MKYTLRPQNPVGLFLGHLFLSPYIAMLIIGTLGHHFNLPADSWVFHFGYWNTFLAVWLLQVVWPQNSPNTFDIEENKN